MLEVSVLEVGGVQPSLYGMRHPLQSHDKSTPFSDLRLAYNLICAGDEHAKFLRQIQVWLEITAPRYWWIEFDTYKVGTTCNSESTMHRIMAKCFTRDDFEWDEMNNEDYIQNTLDYLNDLRDKYLDSDKDKTIWKELIIALPQSYKQKRVVCLSYAVLRRIYFQRKGHKLVEWHTFIDSILEQLPLSWMITVTKETNLSEIATMEEHPMKYMKAYTDVNRIDIHAPLSVFLRDIATALDDLVFSGKDKYYLLGGQDFSLTPRQTNAIKDEISRDLREMYFNEVDGY